MNISTRLSINAESSETDIAEILCSDQIERWRAGDRMSVERYLAEYPVLASDEEALFELVYGEFAVRDSLGESPTIDEYTERFPRFAERFSRQAAIHRAFLSDLPDDLPDEEPPVAITEVAALETEPRNQDPSFPSIKGYEILGELGRGATGVVYKARHIVLKRVVALKIIQPRIYQDRTVVARFRLEAETASNLQHPNIIQIYELGEYKGQGYLAFEQASGGNLREKIAGKPQPPRNAATLVECISRAVHHAHVNGVLHRDLKPANVVLASDGTPKITDFGLAKLIEHDDGLTQTGDILGTPSYMAPEQARGDSEKVTAATDVHALGAILYEMLTGRPPYQGATPLTTLDQVVAHEPLAPCKLQRNTPRDLETICLKCLEKEPKKRYATALELAEDLRRFLENRPIRARRLGHVGRFCRWSRREPALAALSATLVACVVAGFAVTATLWRRAELKARDESIARGRAEFAENAARDRLYTSQIAAARLEWSLDHLPRAESILDECEPARRGWEWRHLKNLNHPEIYDSPNPDFPLALDLAQSADGAKLAVAAYNPYAPKEAEYRSVINIWNTNEYIKIELFRFKSIVYRVDFDSPGERLLVSLDDGSIRVIDLASKREIAAIQAGGSGQFSPDGSLILAGGKNFLTLYDPASGKVIRRFPAEPGRATFSPDGRIVAVSSVESIVLYDFESGRELRRLAFGAAEKDARVFRFFRHEGPDLAFSPDASLVAAASAPPTIWDINTGRPLYILGGHQGEALGIAFSPDGRLVATAGADSTIRLWDALTGSETEVLRGHPQWAAQVLFHPDGARLASVGREAGELKIWDLTRSPQYLTSPNIRAHAIVFDSGDRALRSIDRIGRIERRDLDGASPAFIGSADVAPKWLVPAVLADFSDDARTLAVVSSDQKIIKVINALNSDLIATLRGLEFAANSVDCGGDGTIVAAAAIERDKPLGPAREIRVWNVASRKSIAVFHPFVANTRRLHGSVAIAPDGRSIAYDDYPPISSLKGLGHPRAVVRVRSLADAAESLALPLDDHYIDDIAFSLDGRKLAAIDVEGEMIVWDFPSKSIVFRLQGDGNDTYRCEFSPDGRRIAVVDREKIRIHDSRDGKEILVLRVSSRRPFDGGYNPVCAWSRDGKSLAASTWNEKIAVWEAPDELSRQEKFKLSNDRTFTWRLNVAESALAQDRSKIALFHLKRLRNQSPPDRFGAYRRAELFMRFGDWLAARGDYTRRLDDLEPDDGSATLGCARVLLILGEKIAYQKYRSYLQKQISLGEDRDPDWRPIRALLLAPVERSLADNLGDCAARSYDRPRYYNDPREEDALNLCLARYRAERYAEALAAWDRYSTDYPYGSKWYSPVYALILHRLGRVEEAHARLDDAEKSRRSAPREEFQSDSTRMRLPPAYADFIILYDEAVKVIRR